ncbi:uncharacterized protein N7458_000617 [Penicillium daleae]|uniref:Uncharacterized protein n=1 Tax=Penicillium daleae TaxID=63821 RepID=A0AAD6CIR1_9EURO|nr:uncharacterized protein N7458_000617 [Penicillium daleae]KAJ5464931.1 hypothetical protein N7458_000617 [Penicillium daleae]
MHIYLSPEQGNTYSNSSRTDHQWVHMEPISVAAQHPVWHPSTSTVQTRALRKFGSMPRFAGLVNSRVYEAPKP